MIDRQHAKGAVDKIKGAVKDAFGKATGNRKMQFEGKVDKLTGAAHTLAGNVKEAARGVMKR